MEVVLDAMTSRGGTVALERRTRDDGGGEDEEAIYRGDL
jgi:hypothetical protein